VCRNRVVALLAVAVPLTRVASVVVMPTNVPFDAVLHVRSDAGFVVRAGAPGEVFVAVQKPLDACMVSVHGALALTVNVGPVVALKPASKSAGVGAVREVDPALTCSLTTLPAVIDTLPSCVQLAGAPLAVHCAATVDGFTHAKRAIAVSAAQRLLLFIVSPARLERFRKT
jgi:uncharacterized Zn-binding protein involved in type VI secretion